MKYTIKLTTKRNGFTLHECFDETGKLIGKRTSKSRVYPFCVIVRKSKSVKLRKLKTGIKYNRKQRQFYSEIQRLYDEQGLQAALDFHRSQNRNLSRYFKEWCEKRAFEKWANRNTQNILKEEQLIREINEGKHDAEFEEPSVESWHGRRDLCKEWPAGSYLVQLGIGQAIQEESQAAEDHASLVKDSLESALTSIEAIKAFHPDYVDAEKIRELEVLCAQCLTDAKDNSSR